MADHDEAREVMERLQRLANAFVHLRYSTYAHSMNDARDLIARLLADLDAATKRAEAAEQWEHVIRDDEIARKFYEPDSASEDAIDDYRRVVIETAARAAREEK